MKRGLGCLLVVLVVATCASAQESVADAARRLKREKESAPKSAPKAKHVFTDDDVKHGGNEFVPDQKSSVDAELAAQATIENYMHETEAYIDSLNGKTERQLGDEVTGGASFPGYDLWEQRLAAQRDRLVNVTRESLRNLRSLYSRLMNNDRTKETREALAAQLDAIGLERFRYDALIAEGKRAAAEWKRR